VKAGFGRTVVIGVGIIGVLALIATSLVSAQSPMFTPVGTIPGPVELIRVRGALVFVSSDKTFTVYDVSDPASPKRVGAYTFPQHINGFRATGPLVYVAADRFGLGILEVSTTGAPVLRGSLKTPGQAKNVAVSGTRVLVADALSGLDIVDVSNPTKPVLAGSVFLDGVATDVVAAETLAYAADRPTGFHVVDPAKSGDVPPVASLQSTIPSAFQAQVEVLQLSPTSPRTAVVSTNGLLQLFDVSTPTAPVALPPYRTAGGIGRIAVNGALAYMPSGAEGLQVVDFSQPTTPKQVGAYKVPGPVRDVAVAGPLVFIVAGNGDVMIIRHGN
jgi:hypothetical protein